MTMEQSDRRRTLLSPGKGADKQKESGKLFARERIAQLLDAGSFVEVGAFAGTSQQENSSVIAGYGTILERQVYVYAQDFTQKAGAISAQAADKILRVMELAGKTGCPVISLCDSAGARVDQGASSLDAYARVMACASRLSGVVPQIAVVLGPCAGGAAVIAQLSDFVIQAEVGSQFLTSPQVVASRSKREINAKNLGGVDVAAEHGGVHLACKEEADALASTRKLISMLPANNEEDAPLAAIDDLNRPINADGSDARTLIAQLSDYGDWMELQASYASNMTIALCVIGGRTVGVVANNPTFDEGILCDDAAIKAARFVRFCDAFNLPILTLVNTPGVATAVPEGNIQMLRAMGKMVYAFAEATSPKVAVITGQAIGLGYATMASRGLGSDILLAWPNAVIAPLPPQSAIHILNREEIEKGAQEEELEKTYIENNGAVHAAELGLVDDIIDPATTRQLIVASLEATLGKRERSLSRKHGNMPL